MKAALGSNWTWSRGNTEGGVGMVIDANRSLAGRNNWDWTCVSEKRRFIGFTRRVLPWRIEGEGADGGITKDVSESGEGSKRRETVKGANCGVMNDRRSKSKLLDWVVDVVVEKVQVRVEEKKERENQSHNNKDVHFSNKNFLGEWM